MSPANSSGSGASNAKVYVGNLAWSTSDESLRDTFSTYGQVTDAVVMRDQGTRRSRGFGFVEFSALNEANAAIASLNEQDLDGRRIRVNLANRPAGGGGFDQRPYGFGQSSGGYDPRQGGYSAGSQGGYCGGQGGYSNQIHSKN